MQITWYGTASIRIDLQELSLLFDPFVPLAEAPYSVAVEDFLPAPHIFITHGHLDHLSSVPSLAQLGAGKVYATATPCATLVKRGVSAEAMQLVKPGNELCFSGGKDNVFVAIKKGRHIRFDVPLILATLFNRRMIRYAKNAGALLKSNRIFTENNETVVYEVFHGSTHVTVMGSLALDENEDYRQGPDLLVIPFQGHSHLTPIALSVIERLQPRAVLLDHWDDTFPPISRQVDTAPFIEAMSRFYPQIKVIIPRRGVPENITPQ